MSTAPLPPTLYSGPGLPPATSDQIALPVKTDAELVTDSIRQIILTSRGERLMQPDFGCNIRHMIFDPADAIFQKKIEYFITSAVQKYEPRVQMLSYSFQRTQNTVLITYVFRLIQIGLTASGTVTLPKS